MIENTAAIVLGAWGYAVIALGVMTVAIGPLLDWRRLRNLRRKHFETHPNLSAEDFIRQINIPSERAEVALGVRQGVARAMRVPPATVYPSDDWEYICQFGFDNMDFLDVFFPIEKVLRVPKRGWIWKFVSPTWPAPNHSSLGDLVRLITENWDFLSAGAESQAGTKT